MIDRSGQAPLGTPWSHELQKLDTQVLAAIIRQRRRALDPVAVFFSVLGEGGILWAVVALVLDSPDNAASRRRAAGISLATAGAAYVTSALVARLIGRARPCHRGTPALSTCPSGPGMPSDQSASAFSGAILLGFLQPSARPLLVTLAGAVSLSRVYIGVHYPSDVAVGAIYGLGAGVAVAKVLL